MSTHFEPESARKYVKVSLLNGSSLTPLPPIASKAPNARYFHIFEGEVIDEELMASWIRQAAALPATPYSKPPVGAPTGGLVPLQCLERRTE